MQRRDARAAVRAPLTHERWVSICAAYQDIPPNVGANPWKNCHSRCVPGVLDLPRKHFLKKAWAPTDQKEVLWHKPMVMQHFLTFLKELAFQRLRTMGHSE